MLNLFQRSVVLQSVIPKLLNMAMRGHNMAVRVVQAWPLGLLFVMQLKKRRLEMRLALNFVLSLLNGHHFFSTFLMKKNGSACLKHLGKC